MVNLRSFYRGDNVGWTMEFTFNGSPMNLTDCTVWFTLKKNEDDTEIVLQKSVNSHTDPTEGITILELNSTETNIEPRDYYYGFQLVDSAGKVKTLATGKVKVKKDITIRKI